MVGHNDRANGDLLSGLGGNDQLHTGWGPDVVNGGAGNDKLWGDTGNDTESGGTGADQFLFSWQMGSKDVITDFSLQQHDTVQISDLWVDNATIQATIVDSFNHGYIGQTTETAMIQKWASSASGGTFFHTEASWLQPQNVDGSGPLDAVLQAWSPEWVQLANDIHWRAEVPQYTVNGTYSYGQKDMPDTVTFLNWGGDTNNDGKPDYYSIIPQSGGGYDPSHPGDTSSAGEYYHYNTSYAFADHYLV